MALNALKKITIRDVIKGKPEMKKITIPQVNTATGEVEQIDKMVAVAQDLVALYGRAFNHRTGDTPLGQFIEYVGTFEARRVKDGEVFQSTRIIFPPIAADMAQVAYAGAKREDEGAAVDLAFVVGVEPDPMGVTGYKYTCKPIKTGSAENDPLSELRAMLGAEFSAVLGSDVASRMGLLPPPETGSEDTQARLEAPGSQTGNSTETPATAPRKSRARAAAES